MTTAIIDLNDSDIRCKTLSAEGPNEIVTSTGYALLAREGITTGEPALRKAWLEPQQSFNQFWHQLNLSPLPGHHHHARHHADLAFAQLQALYENCGKPEEVIFAVPGSFNAEQLSILLGLANACPFRTGGLVDAAVAAASGSNLGGRLLHLDIQIHQTVITLLDANEQVQRTAVEVLPDAGLKTFQDTWAHQIANQFIRQYRYDPLHTAAGEQQLYDRLPGWLVQLENHPEISVEMTAPQGELHLQLPRRELLAGSNGRIQRLVDAIANKGPVDAVIASHRVAALPGLAGAVGADLVLPPDSTLLGCETHLERIRSSGDSVDFVTRLPRHAETPSKATSSVKALPSHVLYRNRAWPIGRGLAIHKGNGGLRLASGTQGDTLLLPEQGRLRLQGKAQTSGNPNNLGLGDTLGIDGEILTLIELAD